MTRSCKRTLSCVWAAAAAASMMLCGSASAQPFGGANARVQAAYTSWRKLSQTEVNCVDRALRTRRSNLHSAIQRGIDATHPSMASIRASCRTQQRPDEPESTPATAQTQPAEPQAATSAAQAQAQPKPRTAERKPAEVEALASTGNQSDNAAGGSPEQRAAIRAAEKALSDKVAAEITAIRKAAAERLAVDKEAAEKAAGDQTADQPADQAADRSMADQRAAEQVASQRIDDVKAAAARQAALQTPTQAAEQKAAQDRAAREKAAQQRAAEKAAQENAAREKAAHEKAAAERRAAEEAAARKAAQQKAAADRRAAEQAAEKAAADKALADKAAEERAVRDTAAAARPPVMRTAAVQAGPEPAPAAVTDSPASAHESARQDGTDPAGDLAGQTAYAHAVSEMRMSFVYGLLSGPVIFCLGGFAFLFLVRRSAAPTLDREAFDSVVDAVLIELRQHDHRSDVRQQDHRPIEPNTRPRELRTTDRSLYPST